MLRRLKTFFFRRNLRIKKETYWHYSATAAHSNKLKLGDFCYVGSDTFINAEGGVEIGDGSVLSSKVSILSSTHEYTLLETLPYDRKSILNKVCIEEGVWIGYNALVFPGVTVGKGAIVGACSVVTKNVENFTVVAGNPAKIISKRDPDECQRIIKNQAYLNKVHRRKW